VGAGRLPKGDEKFDVPAVHISSWYDFGVDETLLEFNLLRTNAVSDRARNNQFAVISPTSHCRSEFGTTTNTIVGERELGDAQLDYYTLYLQWCTGTPDAAEGSFDQSEVEARNDVLVYTTPELREGVKATGPIKAVLYVSSSAVPATLASSPGPIARRDTGPAGAPTATK
jgi:predicted acyl esterase